MDSSVIIPITFWGDSQPSFRISSTCTTPNCEKLVTGSYTGHLCLWDLNIKLGEITPSNVLIGHRNSITCMVCTNEFIISSCEGGEMFRWNIEDGYCSKTRKSLFIHRNMQLLEKTDCDNDLLFTSGDYSEIFIIHPFTLQIILVLHSQNDCDWISSFHVIQSQNDKSKIVSGITPNGCLKLWTIDKLTNDSQNEVQCKILPVKSVVDLKYNSNETELLIVSFRYWTLFDSKLLNCLCKVEAVDGEKLLGGTFSQSEVVVWSNSGKLYIYKVEDSSYELILTLVDVTIQSSLFDLCVSILKTQENEKYLVMSDPFGKVNIWDIGSPEISSLPLLSTILKFKWFSTENGIFNKYANCSNVTCCIYVLELDRFFIGCVDGSIISIPAMQMISSFYFDSPVNKSSNDILLGHNGRINCLLYPNAKYSHFNKSHMVSGSSDFSVCLWDIYKSELLHKFCIQSGEIIKLLIPPEDCSFRVKHSICSVASDHSVAILNLKDRKCIILTSRHEFPVVTVNWKPLDDFIIIECFDGTVYVWQMETGHLDRVLNGVLAQEVVYACNEYNVETGSEWNFYIDEHALRKNSMKREVFQIDEGVQRTEQPFVLNGFLVNDSSESHIFSCNVEYLISKINSTLKTKVESTESIMCHKIYLLTQALSSDYNKKPTTLLEKIKMETEYIQERFQQLKNDKVKPNIDKNNQEILNHVEYNSFYLTEKIIKMIQFFLSSIHIWGLNPTLDKLLTTKLGLIKPVVPLPIGIFSQSGTFSLFLPTNSSRCRKSSTVMVSICITMIAFSRIFELSSIGSSIFLGQDKVIDKSDIEDCWRSLITFYEGICLNPSSELKLAKPKMEILAKAWQIKSTPLRNIMRKLLSGRIQAFDENEYADLLSFWYNYLPHFKILDKTSSEKFDYENLDLKTVALVLYGAVGADLKFRANDFACQDNYIYQTCASFVYLMLLPDKPSVRFDALQTIAVDFIGRGYIVWEQYLKMEKILPVLFRICSDLRKINFESHDTDLDKCLTAHDALKSIAIARTAAFIKCIMDEINLIKQPHISRASHFTLENSKSEILSIIIYLLEKTPYIMVLYLNDIVSIFVYCIDFSHLKQESLPTLVPVMKKFRQVHHSVVSQKIAVGLPTGSIVFHDLKTGKTQPISAHKDSVSAVKFSEDGKILASYSCYENRISFWQMTTGILGLGLARVKCIKSLQTCQIHDEEIRNHLEIAQITWIDNKSVALSLCDGTETVYHS